MYHVMGPLLVIVGYREYVGNYAQKAWLFKEEDSFKPMATCHAIIV